MFLKYCTQYLMQLSEGKSEIQKIRNSVFYQEKPHFLCFLNSVHTIYCNYQKVSQTFRKNQKFCILSEKKRIFYVLKIVYTLFNASIRKRARSH